MANEQSLEVAKEVKEAMLQEIKFLNETLKLKEKTPDWSDYQKVKDQIALAKERLEKINSKIEKMRKRTPVKNSAKSKKQSSKALKKCVTCKGKTLLNEQCKKWAACHAKNGDYCHLHQDQRKK